MSQFTYYLTQDDKGFVSLRQTRYRAQYLNGDEHPHDVCAVARDKPEMRGMAERCKIDSVDWDSLYDWRDTDWLSVPISGGDVFRWGFRKSGPPLNVLILTAGHHLICMGGSRNLREDWFDNATWTNARACKSLFIFDDYATAMMGGEPYSDWN